MKLTKAIASLIVTSAGLALVSAECPNACSGHGMCGAKDMCTCDRNFQGSDCSLRTCPFGVSHVDTPKGDLDSDAMTSPHNVDKIVGSTVYPHGTTESYPHMVDTANVLSIDTAHAYSECSNKGLCDRISGSCECLPGYEGASCQRAACPAKGVEKRSDAVQREQSKFINQRGTSALMTSVFDGISVMNIPIGTCSGHGVCRTIEKLASEDGGNFYGLWDKESSMGCECDPGYTGADCSERQCTYGIDPLWIDDTTARVTQTAVRFKTVDANTLAGEYAIKFYDVFGEDYITQPLALSATGSGHCADVVNALKGLPDNVISDVTCQDLVAINTNEGFKYVLTFIGNPGKLRQLEIVEKLDGDRSTVLAGPLGYTANVYTKVKGEFVDNFATKCEGITLKVVVDHDGANAWETSRVRPGSLGYLTGMSDAEEKLLKACLGDSDGDIDNNVDVTNWDHGFVYEAHDATTPSEQFKMIGSFPHAIKVVPKEDAGGYTTFTGGQYYLVWYDDTPDTSGVLGLDGKRFRVANVNHNIHDPSIAQESYVYTTNGVVRQLGWDSGQELADNQASGSSTPRIVAYFDAYSNKLYTNYDTSCENDADPLSENHQCVEKGDQLFIVDGCWGKGNSGASTPILTPLTPFFGGVEVSCTDSTNVNHNTGNLYTVTKVYRQPLLTNESTDSPAKFTNVLGGDIKKYVDTFVIEVDINLGWEGPKGDPENTAASPFDTSDWADNTGIVTLFHFTPAKEGSYEYVSQCSNRGLCDSSGICKCFSGYTGADCSIQSALSVSGGV